MLRCISYSNLFLFLCLFIFDQDDLVFVPFATLINIHLRISEIYLRVPEWFPQGCKVKIVNYDGN